MSGSGSRWPWIAAVVIVLSGAAALGLMASYFVSGQKYVSEATVLINPLIGNPYDPSADDVNRALETESRVAVSDAVLRETADRLGRDEPGGLTGAVGVDLVPGSQVLEFRFEASGAGEAREGATALADAYLAHRSSQAEESAASTLDAIDSELEASTAALQEARADATAAQPGSVGRVVAERRLERASAAIATLTDRRYEIEAALGPPGEVLTPATLPPEQSAALRATIVAGSAFLGALGGLLAAWAVLFRGRGGAHALTSDVQAPVASRRDT